MRSLQDCYDLHPLAVEDAINADQLPKVDVYGDQLFVVARTPHLEGETIEYGETAIFVGHSHIISVRHGSTRAHTALREQLEKAPRLLMHGVDYLLHAILDYIVDGFRPLVEQLEEEGLEMEQHAIESFLSRDEVNRIFTLRRELVRFQRILGPMDEMAQNWPAGSSLHRCRCAPLFRDVQDLPRSRFGRGLREGDLGIRLTASGAAAHRHITATGAWRRSWRVPPAIADLSDEFDNMPDSDPLGIHCHRGILAICAWLSGVSSGAAGRAGTGFA